MGRLCRPPLRAMAPYHPEGRFIGAPVQDRGLSGSAGKVLPGCSASKAMGMHSLHLEAGYLGKDRSY